MKQDGAPVTVRKPTIDAALCTSCGACMTACPVLAIVEPQNYTCAKCVKYCATMEVPCTPVGITICSSICDGCGRCIPACPNGAIIF